MRKTPPSTADVLDYAAPGRTSVARAPRPPVVRIVLFGLLLYPLFLIVGYPIAAALPYGWDAGAWVEVPTTRPGLHGGTAAFHIAARGAGRGRRCRMEWGYVTYSGIERFGLPQVNLRAMTYARDYYGPLRPLTREEIAGRLTDAGFDSAEAAEMAVAILLELRSLSDGKLPPDLTGQPYGGQVPALRYSMRGTTHITLGEFGHLLWLPWYAPWCVPLWLLAWVLMGKWFLRQHRRRLEEE